MLLDAEAEGDGGADEERDEQDVAERVADVAEEAPGLGLGARVLAVRLLAMSNVGAVPADAKFHVGVERGSDAGTAAQAEEVVRPLVLDEGLEELVVIGGDIDNDRHVAGG